jgi:hypothetical protein
LTPDRYSADLVGPDQMARHRMPALERQIDRVGVVTLGCAIAATTVVLSVPGAACAGIAETVGTVAGITGGAAGLASDVAQAEQGQDVSIWNVLGNEGTIGA